jgi:hypothetical protein
MSPRLRHQVRTRAAGRCEYCRLPDWVEFAGPFHVEHIIARQHAGVNQSANLAWACSRCNSHKGTNLAAIDPDGKGLVALFNPRKDSWPDHFRLSGPYISGRTPTGRATVWLLQMNAERRLELRAQLISAGLR